MMKRFELISALLCAIGCLTLSGCGGGGSGDTVSGTVTVDGKPPAEGAQMMFENNERSVPMGVLPDGRFSGEITKPGKYKVTLRILDKNGKDTLGGRFDLANSKIDQEVTGPASDVKIEFK